MTFSDLSLAEPLSASVKRMGFDRPTPIQTAAIPPALAGRDVLASAATGSGKTAAFLLPIMHRLLQQPRGTTRALVLAPTRELAAQITDHFKRLALGTRLSCAAVHGGVGMAEQSRAFRGGTDMIVACPGRLLDHLSRPQVRLSALEHLVLDEADRMLDMGFLPDIRRVLAAIPRDRQTLFFSATLPQPIVELSRELLRDPARINIDRTPAPASGITHVAYPVSTERKSALLLRLLQGDISGSSLVFTRTKRRANRLADFLDEHGIPCARIHGNRSQGQRTAALEGFRKGRFRVLVATDIAARGIDVEALGSVVNFDVPNQPDDYIHRVGRTARAELTGDAYTLVSPDEEKDVRAIERALGKRLPRQKLAGFDDAAGPAPAESRRASHSAGRSGQRRPSMTAAARSSGRHWQARRGSPRGRTRRAARG